MGTSSKKKASVNGMAIAPIHSPFSAAKDGLDPVLASLFATSSGPVKLPSKATVAQFPNATNIPAKDEDSTSSESSAGDSESEREPSVKNSDSVAASSADQTSTQDEESRERPRKRRRVVNEDELEDVYFQRLERAEQKKRLETPKGVKPIGDNSTSASEDSDDNLSDRPGPGDVPEHESLRQISKGQDAHLRTIFLSNVSVECIKTKGAKRTLTRALRDLAKGTVLGKFESIRFRSTAYMADSGPKKATYAKKELMEATTKSTHAYAVFTTEAAAKHVASKLNGTLILDRHVRAEHLNTPTQTDHKRCIFVGNLSFVDEEPADLQATSSRPKAKEPADAEEGLWRVFGKLGPIDYVRVVRDQETRVSKGFAYVQFKDENCVEKALLMNEKKFPPMLPRKLRIMRARKVKAKPTSAVPANQRGELGTDANRRGNSFGPRRNARPKSFGSAPGAKSVVFEGQRATERRKGKPTALKARHARKKRPETRSSRRGAAFKAAGGRNKRKRDE